jgi:hypothetical protein
LYGEKNAALLIVRIAFIATQIFSFKPKMHREAQGH